jgi:hypothetical protein
VLALSRRRHLLCKSDYRAAAAIGETHLDIALAGVNREAPGKGFKPTLTCNFTVCEGDRSTHAEVIFPDGGEEILQREGKDVKKVARIALERLLNHTANPFSSLLSSESRQSTSPTSPNTVTFTAAFPYSSRGNATNSS